MAEYSININSLISALIGGSLTLLGVIIAHLMDVSRQEKNEEKLINGLLQAIHDETKTLWERYMEGIGNKLEKLPNGKGFFIYYPLTQEYFTIYNGNSFLIGRIPDNNLRMAIVNGYSGARGLIDAYRLNNDFVQKYEQSYFLFHKTKKQEIKEEMMGYVATLVDYAGTLKRLHNELKENVNDLLKMLEKKNLSREETGGRSAVGRFTKRNEHKIVGKIIRIVRDIKL